MNIIITAALIILLLYIVINCQKIREHYDSDEAIANLASLYNKDKLTVTDIDVTKDANVGGSMYVDGSAAFQNYVDVGKSLTFHGRGTLDVDNGSTRDLAKCKNTNTISVPESWRTYPEEDATYPQYRVSLMQCPRGYYASALDIKKHTTDTKYLNFTVQCCPFLV